MSLDIHRNRRVFGAALVAVALALSPWATNTLAMQCGEVAVSTWMYHNYSPNAGVTVTEFLQDPAFSFNRRTYIGWVGLNPAGEWVGMNAGDVAQIRAAGGVAGVLAQADWGEARIQELASWGFDWIILDEITWQTWLHTGYNPSTGLLAAYRFNALRNAARNGNANVRVAAVEPFWDMMNALLTNGATPDMVMGEDYYNGDGRNIRRVHLDQWAAQGYHVGQWVVGTAQLPDYSGTEMIVTADWGDQPWGLLNYYEALPFSCSYRW